MKFIAFAVTVVLCVCATQISALSTGAPVCTIQRNNSVINGGIQMKNNNASRLASPNNWTVVLNQTSLSLGGSLQVTVVKNVNASQLYRGILVWASDQNNNIIGNFTAANATGFKVPSACNSQAGASITHISKVGKEQSNKYYFTAPSNSTATSITFNAFLVEDCGQSSCSGNWYFAANVTIALPITSAAPYVTLSLGAIFFAVVLAFLQF